MLSASTFYEISIWNSLLWVLLDVKLVPTTSTKAYRQFTHLKRTRLIILVGLESIIKQIQFLAYAFIYVYYKHNINKTPSDPLRCALQRHKSVITKIAKIYWMPECDTSRVCCNSNSKRKTFCMPRWFTRIAISTYLGKPNGVGAHNTYYVLTFLRTHLQLPSIGNKLLLKTKFYLVVLCISAAFISRIFLLFAAQE